MCVTLESLPLTAEELESVRETVRRMAYFRWLDAGCPAGKDLDFWLEAERQWIAFEYVPDRVVEQS